MKCLGICPPDTKSEHWTKEYWNAFHLLKTPILKILQDEKLLK
jgi:hypothetical protein